MKLAVVPKDLHPYWMGSGWKRFGIDCINGKLLAERESTTPIKRMLLAMVANRVVTTCSRLGKEDWVAEDVVVTVLGNSGTGIDVRGRGVRLKLPCVSFVGSFWVALSMGCAGPDTNLTSQVLPPPSQATVVPKAQTPATAQELKPASLEPVGTGARTVYIRFKDNYTVRIILTDNAEEPILISSADATTADALRVLFTGHPVTGFYAAGSFLTEEEAEANKHKQASFDPGAAHPLGRQPTVTAYNSKSVYHLTFRTGQDAMQVKEALVGLGVVAQAQVYDDRIVASSN